MQSVDHETRFPRIAHIITDMNGFGGTEATLLRYITESRIPIESHLVIVLKSIGEGDTLGARMVAAGVKAVALGETRGSMSASTLLHLYRELKAFDPDVISGWLYHPSLLASLIAPFLKRSPAVVWHIRCSIFASLVKTPGRFIVQRVLSVLSRLTNPVMVSNSSVAVREHATLGFDVRPHRWTIIHNGIDSGQYCPHLDDGKKIRGELHIPEDALLVGCVGRFVPEKGYDVLFDALAHALSQLPSALAERVHVLAMGDGVTMENEGFMNLAIGKLPLDRLHLLGKRADVQRVLRAFDVYVLPSVSEAFPNSLVEAMATGLPCIATNVGECREVLSAPELIVPPGNAMALAKLIANVVAMNAQERAALGEGNRQRIVACFGLDRMVASFDGLFTQAATARRDCVSETVA